MRESDEIRNRMMDAAVDWAQRVGDDLHGRAVPLAPILTSHLRGSGHVEVEESLGRVDVTVSFDTPYAAKQHEELDYNHPRGGQAKYLEQPYLEQLPRYVELFYASQRRALT